MITNNNDNIAQQWFTLKSKKEFQHSAMGETHPDYMYRCNRFPIRTSQAESVFLCLFVCFVCQLASSHHVAARCRLCADDIPIKVMFQFQWSAPPDEHPVTLDHTVRSSIARMLLFFLVIVYKYRIKINYSMLASYCCRLRVLSLPPCQILCHRTHTLGWCRRDDSRRFALIIYLLALSSHLLFIAFFLLLLCLLY